VGVGLERVVENVETKSGFDFYKAHKSGKKDFVFLNYTRKVRILGQAAKSSLEV